jgi:hypothetical protein
MRQSLRVTLLAAMLVTIRKTTIEIIINKNTCVTRENKSITPALPATDNPK